MSCSVKTILPAMDLRPLVICATTHNKCIQLLIDSSLFVFEKDI